MGLHPQEEIALARLRRHPEVARVNWDEDGEELDLVLASGYACGVSGISDVIARELARVVRVFGPAPGEDVRFCVRYYVRGVEGEREAGPYDAFEIEAQRDDIATYEGVSDVRVVVFPQRT